MPALQIDDGFTLDGRTTAVVSDPVTGRALHNGLPEVAFRYRPALPDALAEWRYAMRAATTGRAQVDATAQFVAAHLVSWDVTDAKGAPLPITADAVRKVPEPILDQLVEAVSKWAPKHLAAALGN